MYGCLAENALQLTDKVERISNKSVLGCQPNPVSDELRAPVVSKENRN